MVLNLTFVVNLLTAHQTFSKHQYQGIKLYIQRKKKGILIEINQQREN